MLIASVAGGHSSIELGTWLSLAAVVLSGAISGLIVQWRADRRAKKLEPAQNEALRAQATKAAVETVESALAVARERIESLEKRVAELSEKIGELRGKLEYTTSDRESVKRELVLTMIERAKLQQQIVDIRVQLAREGHGDIHVQPPDAILMVGLADGIISYATDGVFDLLGYPPGELVGKLVDRLVPAPEREHHAEQRVVFAGERRTRAMGSGIDLRAITAAGDEIPVDISLHPTGDDRVLVLIKRRQVESRSAVASGSSGSGSTSTVASGSEAGVPAT